MDRTTTARTIRRATTIALLGALAFAAATEGADGRSFRRAAQGDWSKLEAAAREDGRVPVIVSIRTRGIDPLTVRPQRLFELGKEAGAAKKDLLAALPGEEKKLKEMEGMPLIALHATPDQLAELRSSDLVASVVEDRSFSFKLRDGGRTRTEPHAPQKADVPPAPRTGGVAGTSPNGSADGQQLASWWDWYRIGVDRTTRNGYTGSGQTVVIIDTGVDGTHPWLAGKVVAEACFATNPVGVTGGGCPNGSYYQYGAGAAAPCTFSYDCAHGTHVAHTAAGKHGVAPDAKIVAIQVFHRNPHTGDAEWAVSDIYNALWYVHTYIAPSYRVAAVNMSIGIYNRGYLTSCDSFFDAGMSGIISYVGALLNVGIPTVISSGNDNYANAVAFPSCISKAVSVGNTTLTPSGVDAVYGGVFNGSNGNGTLDLLAPGTDICSAVPSWLDIDGRADGWSCTYVGTSMAAPHVAGAFAVLRGKRPSATVSQMLSALRASGVMVTDTRTRNNWATPRINVWNALGRI